MAAKQKIGLIVGPTASGKTEVSIRLAKLLDAEIISADSIQIYRGMDIGSAKPTMAEREGVPHHLIDALDINSPRFSVAEYQRMAADAITEVASRGKYPLIVGGTGLYVNSLIYPLNFTAVPSDEGLRNELLALEANRRGSVYALLQKEDPSAAKRLHPNDTKRVVRALEVVRLSGKAMDDHGGDFSNTTGADIPYIPRIAGITMPREMLYERINRRVDMMLKAGLVEEARALYDAKYLRALPALQGLGYKQLFRCFDGLCTLDEAVEAIKLETRHFAKRQMTWFKRDKRIVWFDRSIYADVGEITASIYKVITEGEKA